MFKNTLKKIIHKNIKQHNCFNTDNKNMFLDQLYV